MVRVHFRQEPGGIYRVTVSGHAGPFSVGEDKIACASLSSLLEAVGGYGSLHEKAKFLAREPGFVDLELKDGTLFSLLEFGIHGIERVYPNALIFEYEE